MAQFTLIKPTSNLEEFEKYKNLHLFLDVIVVGSIEPFACGIYVRNKHNPSLSEVFCGLPPTPLNLGWVWMKITQSEENFSQETRISVWSLALQVHCGHQYRQCRCIVWQCRHSSDKSIQKIENLNLEINWT